MVPCVSTKYTYTGEYCTVLDDDTSSRYFRITFDFSSFDLKSG